MCSKPKVNGASSVRCVTEAQGKSGMSMEGFFTEATRVANDALRARGKKGDDLHKEGKQEIRSKVEQFKLLRDRGVSACPGYSIPDHVLDYAADMIRRRTCKPKRQRRWADDRRPALAMGGH